MIRQRSAALVVAAALTAVGSAACTTDDAASTDAAPAEVTTTTAAPPASARSYEVDLIAAGSEPRFPLVAPVPVGRSVDISVVFESRGEAVTVLVEAEVVASVAGGGGKQVDLVVANVAAEDPDTVAALEPIVGASSQLVLDERRAVVEQSLSIPEGLTFRADTIVGQALRAPFALAGPLPLDPVGVDASWSVVDTVSETTVQLTMVDADSYRLRIESVDATVDVSSSAGRLLPERQTIELVDATLTITSERSGQ